VHTHKMMQSQLKYFEPDQLGEEPVHPNATGHLLLAHEWLKAVGW